MPVGFFELKECCSTVLQQFPVRGGAPVSVLVILYKHSFSGFFEIELSAITGVLYVSFFILSEQALPLNMSNSLATVHQSQPNKSHEMQNTANISFI